MVTLINYHSGELVIQSSDGHSIRLAHPQSHRLVMTARMQGVNPFIKKLPQLIPDEKCLNAVQATLQEAPTSDRWILKEIFARLHTVTPGITVPEPDKIAEVVKLAI